MANDSKKLKLCHINTRSILAYNNEFKTNQVKMDEIRETLCKKFEYDVIATTESWLSPDTSVDSTDLHIDNYTFYRKIVSMLTTEVAAWACLSQKIYYVCSVQT